MKHLLPSPRLSAALLLCWLMLNQSASAGHWLLGTALAVAVPWFSVRLRSEKAHIKAWGSVLRLAGVVLKDIVLSNIEVARRVLGPEDVLRPGWVWVPLDIRDPHGIVALAGIITLTPGTLSAELTEDRRHLLVHAFNLTDPSALVADIKQRYETPLREIFE